MRDNCLFWKARTAHRKPRLRQSPVPGNRTVLQKEGASTRDRSCHMSPRGDPAFFRRFYHGCSFRFGVFRLLGVTAREYGACHKDSRHRRNNPFSVFHSVFLSLLQQKNYVFIISHKQAKFNVHLRKEDLTIIIKTMKDASASFYVAKIPNDRSCVQGRLSDSKCEMMYS